MEWCLSLKKSNCKNCYKCIRYCPVKSIKFSDSEAHIVEAECILCGQCFVACPQNAKEIRNDVPAARALIKSGAKVYASIAPAYIARYEGASIAAMDGALKRLGFAGAEETALGATVVKDRYNSMIKNAEQDVIISSCCSTVMLLIQKHFPEAIPYIAPVLSPMQAHCKDLKGRHPGAKTVFIGPCISKKSEGDSYPGIVDCVLTFEELSRWLLEERIAIEPDEIKDEGRARLFPTSGGIIRTMGPIFDSYSYLFVDGVENCIEAVRDILDKKIKNCFIEMSACSGSCIAGPVMDKKRRLPVREYIAVSAAAGDKDFDVKSPPHYELKKNIPSLAPPDVLIGDGAIEEVLRKMGKTEPDHELNCASCGYSSCRDKARAVIMGKADLSMCLPFLKERAESFSDNIISNTPNAILVLNEALEVQQINQAALRLMNIRDAGAVLGSHVVRILDPTPFVEVHQKGRSVRDERVYLAEYRKYVDQTIIYDKGYHIIICFMRDVTEEAQQRAHKEELSRKTLEITDKVIEKQMRSVQEIASLLGETTAETKIALTKLKESLTNE